jgi:hypothetical protein
MILEVRASGGAGAESAREVVLEVQAGGCSACPLPCMAADALVKKFPYSTSHRMKLYGFGVYYTVFTVCYTVYHYTVHQIIRQSVQSYDNRMLYCICF